MTRPDRHFTPLLAAMAALAPFAILASCAGGADPPAGSGSTSTSGGGGSTSATGGGGSTSASGGGGSGGGGSTSGGGGVGLFCQPGSVESCYSGPQATAGVGACRAGTRTCAPDGSSFSACEGEVLPAVDACGFDGDCDGQMPPPCGVQVLVDTPQPWFLALDPAGDYLFWSKRSFNSPGGIYRVKKDGTDYALLYPNEFDPRGIAADANEIFWTVEDGLRAGPKDGSGASYRYMMPAMFSPEWIALLNDPCPGAFLAAVAVDDTHAYWTVMGDSFCNAVLRVDKTTGAPAVGFLTGILPGAGIALDPADVFFTRGPRRMTKSGAGLTTLSNDDFLEGIAVDAGHVYVKGVTSLVRMEKDGNNPTALASWASCGPGGHYPFNVAVDDTHVYWLDQCGMTVRRVEKSGANETVIGAGAGCLMSIVVDDAAAYWSECLEAGRIMKWTKP